MSSLAQLFHCVVVHVQAYLCRELFLSVYRPEMSDMQFLQLVSKQWNDHCNQMVRG